MRPKTPPPQGQNGHRETGSNDRRLGYRHRGCRSHDSRGGFGVVSRVRQLPHDPAFARLLTAADTASGLATLRCALRLLRVFLREIDSTARCYKSESSRRPLPAVIAGLSERRRQVLRGLKLGQSEKEIAGTLNISRHTVHVHVKLLYQQFGVSSRAELLSLWMSD